MKKYSRIFFYVVMIFMLMFLIMSEFTMVSAENLGNGINNNVLNGVSSSGDSSTANTLKPKISAIFATILKILKYLGVAGIVFTGVKYMYAGSGDKAAIKQSLIYLIIGTVFLFGADIIIGLIIDSWDSTSGYVT